MSKTYNNIAMSKAEQERVEKQDAAWNGPKLILLLVVTLAFALVVLWAAANRHIGPTFHEVW